MAGGLAVVASDSAGSISTASPVRRSLAIFRHNAVLLLSDPGPIVAWIVIPLLLMAVLKPAMGTLLVSHGYKTANGSQQVVPAYTAMFAFFWTGFVGRNFFTEHGWGTWERLQATDATRLEIMTGKLLPAFVIIAVQQAILFGVGSLIYGLHAPAIWAYSLVLLVMIICVLTLSLTLIALTRTLTQIDALSVLLTMLFATLGGVLVPTFALPNWAQHISPALPTYWAMKAAGNLFLKKDGAASVLAPSGVILLFAAGFALVAALRFRFTDEKSVEV
jgi:ABC-2 type transport system permease protein